MKGAFLLSSEPNLAKLVLAEMRASGAEISADGVAQLRSPQDRLFTVFAHPDTDDYSEWRSEPVKLAIDGHLPDMGSLSACWIECRFEDYFSTQVRALALAIPAASWVLDGDGVLWPALDVDPARVRL